MLLGKIYNVGKACLCLLSSSIATLILPIIDSGKKKISDKIRYFLVSKTVRYHNSDEPTCVVRLIHV